MATHLSAVRGGPDDVYDAFGAWVQEQGLELYRKMFGSEFLHVGYFKNAGVPAEDVSLRMLTDAMRDYAELVLQRLRPEDQGKTVLDIGCGIGGLMRMMGERGLQPAGVTPNPIHAELIRKQLPGMTVHLTPFQHLDPTTLPAPYDLATSTEALHTCRSTRPSKSSSRWSSPAAA